MPAKASSDFLKLPDSPGLPWTPLDSPELPWTPLDSPAVPPVRCDLATDLDTPDAGPLRPDSIAATRPRDSDRDRHPRGRPRTPSLRPRSPISRPRTILGTRKRRRTSAGEPRCRSRGPGGIGGQPPGADRVGPAATLPFPLTPEDPAGTPPSGRARSDPPRRRLTVRPRECRPGGERPGPPSAAARSPAPDRVGFATESRRDGGGPRRKPVASRLPWIPGARARRRRRKNRRAPPDTRARSRERSPEPARGSGRQRDTGDRGDRGEEDRRGRGSPRRRRLQPGSRDRRRQRGAVARPVPERRRTPTPGCWSPATPSRT